MGFSQQQAQSAIRRYDSVQQALDSLLAGVGKCAEKCQKSEFKNTVVCFMRPGRRAKTVVCFMRPGRRAKKNM